MKFTKHCSRTARPITNRRIKCAERAIQRKKDSEPLLALLSDYQIETPQERLLRISNDEQNAIDSRRKHIADSWFQSRSYLRSLPVTLRLQFLDYWNHSSCPKTHEYFADLIHSKIKNANMKYPVNIFDFFRDNS